MNDPTRQGSAEGTLPNGLNLVPNQEYALRVGLDEDLPSAGTTVVGFESSHITSHFWGVWGRVLIFMSIYLALHSLIDTDRLIALIEIDR